VANKPVDETMRIDPSGAVTLVNSGPPLRKRELPPRFGRYEVRSLLGSGGMGSVYLAYDTQLDRLIALKVPHVETSEDAELLDRFWAEAHAGAGISHPNLCAVYDFGEIDGVPYFTMTYVRGKPLLESLSGGPMAQEHAAMVVQQVAAAMEVAHRAGIVHRDLKPANILLGEHQLPVVMDFGVARRESAKRRRLTHQGTSLGTPGYMAPEALRGEAMGPPSDIYSLGVSLYQLVTGSLPFDGTAIDTVRRILRGERARPPDELRPGLDGQLVAICMKAMAAERTDRYRNMGEMAEALLEFLRGRSGQFQVDELEPDMTPVSGTAEILSRAGQQLFFIGRWSVAHDVISTAAQLPGLGGTAALRQRNRLVHLCKNMDRWGEALEHSDWCMARLGAAASSEVEADLLARVWVNRGSVLYDLGRREEAGVAFRTGFEHATKCRTGLPRAAASNDLGVYHHYGDRLARAEAILSDPPVDLAPLPAAYLQTNLGLVQLTRSLVDRAQGEAAAQTLSSALEKFVAGGHLQGISYALSNRALCDLMAGRFTEARAAFEETIRLGERLGERWTVYGARANLALVELGRGGNPEAAFGLARDSAARAQENRDPKGVADATLIAARAALEWSARASDAPLTAIDALLEEAGHHYALLGQRLGEALAHLGRLEISRDQELEARAKELLSATELSALPLKFFAPPWHMLLLMELF
jgi:tetratricopeptide (TPR) repeat protein